MLYLKIKGPEHLSILLHNYTRQVTDWNSNGIYTDAVTTSCFLVSQRYYKSTKLVV